MKGDGRYVAHRDLREALDHLRLWELPSLKPEVGPSGGGDRGDLRLV